MELGNQIKALRQGRGITQETLAAALGVSAQAVSKWENAAAAPDIALLPAISAYFGVSIDQLFALSDETRMERIQNMLWTERVISPPDAESAAGFLLDKARREPKSARPWELLAELEEHLAGEHHSRAAEYARAALERDPDSHDSHSTLVQAMHGHCPDWNVANHCALIDWYKDFLEKNPTCRAGYLWLMDQLIDDFRFDEAEEYCARLAAVDDKNFRADLYRGIIAWYKGDRAGAYAIWDAMDMGEGKEWLKHFNLADFLARAGQYEEAKASYRRTLETQKPPRYTDPTTSIAQLCELQGDWAGAIAAHREELDILAAEWNTTSGEQVDHHRREIARLREKAERAKGSAE